MPAILLYGDTPLMHLSQAVNSVLQRGGLVAVPTETFYALAVNPFDETALNRLVTVKGRGEDKPILVLLDSLRTLSSLTTRVPSAASILMEAFWPGALTILFPARPSLAPALTGGSGLVGIRLSSCQPLRDLLLQAGPLTGTSANRTGAPPTQTARDVQQALGDDVDLIIDAGPTPGGQPSTVVEAGESVRLVREGVIPRIRIEEALRARGFSLKNA
jgi:L-threonylcarbamoyladenylate synthase